MRFYFFSLLLVPGLMSVVSCDEQETNQQTLPAASQIPLIIDTDANNELDDQHALAYLLFNDDVFDVKAVTANATFNGGDIAEHMAEARRVMKLCGADQTVPLLEGANGDFEEIAPHIMQDAFDGKEAVDVIIEEARKSRDQPLVLLPVGKLTNMALALHLAPDIRDKVRIVWLGTNYPEPGEYNHVNDIPSTQYVLDQQVPFEWVMVRYGKESGSDAVRATPADIRARMPGMGPQSDSVTGRHGGTFTQFGDYSASLFEHAELHGDPPSRALFDMVAVAILKNPAWGEKRKIPAPRTSGEGWEDQPENARQIFVWENFDKEAILRDFYDTIEQAGSAQTISGL